MTLLLWAARIVVVLSTIGTIYAFYRPSFWLFWVGLAVLTAAVIADHCLGWHVREHDRDEWMRQYRAAVWDRREQR